MGLAQVGRNHAYETDATGAIQHKGNHPTGNEAGTLIVNVPADVFQHVGNGHFRAGEVSLAASDDNGSNQVVVHAFHLTQDPIGGESCTPCLGTGSSSGGASVGVAYLLHGTMASSVASETEVCSPLTCGPSGEIQNRTTTVIVSGLVVRRLTPTECLRLQGLPDDWLDLDDGGKPLSDSAKYRMIGNGGVVPCVQWILDRLRRCVTGCNTRQNSPDLD